VLVKFNHGTILSEQQLISSNIPVAVVAGNLNEDASPTNPSDVQEAIVVGAVDITDTGVPFSNFGATVDLFVPGVGIISTYNDGNITALDGTSMSTPHVAGAIFLGSKPNAISAEISTALTGSALSGRLSDILKSQLRGFFGPEQDFYLIANDMKWRTRNAGVLSVET